MQLQHRLLGERRMPSFELLANDGVYLARMRSENILSNWFNGCEVSRPAIASHALRERQQIVVPCAVCVRPNVFAGGSVHHPNVCPFPIHQSEKGIRLRLD